MSRTPTATDADESNTSPNLKSHVMTAEGKPQDGEKFEEETNVKHDHESVTSRSDDISVGSTFAPDRNISGSRNVRRVAWPVPQVIVRYGNLEQAWGREGLKQLGLQETHRMMCEAFITGAVAGNVRKRRKAHEESPLRRAVFLMGVFHATCGGRDEKPVQLQAVGWREMIDNVEEIILMHKS